MLDSFLFDWGVAVSEPRRHFGLYQERIWEIFKQLDLRPDRDNDFRAKVIHAELANASVTTVLSSTQLVQRTNSCIAKSTNTNFYLGYQLAGYAEVRQCRQSKTFPSRGMFLLDYSEPFDLSLHGSSITGVQVLRLQRTPELEANRERLFDCEKAFAGHRLLPLLRMHISLAATSSHADELDFHCHSAEEILYLLLEADNNKCLPANSELWSRLVREVEGNLADPSFNIAQLAQSCRVSSRYIQKLFAVRGSTFSDFVREKRLTMAASRLRDGSAEASIEDIAYSCGFSDLSTFYRSFKTRYGTKPGSIRQESLLPLKIG